jgi:two-component system, NtrC family, sensor histidine kinase PilS
MREKQHEPTSKAAPSSWVKLTVNVLRPSYDGPLSWLWFVGIARIGLLILLTIGAHFAAADTGYDAFLIIIFPAAFVTCIWYLIELRRESYPSATLTWTQMVVDFAVVAVTVSTTSTGQQISFLTLFFVLVILEGGVLMGLMQGFLFATLASVYMFFLFSYSAGLATDLLQHYYNFLIQGIAFFLTAFISGYWNQRVSRMQQFQREILDNMSSGFLITDAAGVVVAINHAGCAILDLIECDVIGRHVEGIIQSEAGIECPVTTALRLNRDFSSYEFHAQTPSQGGKLLGLTTNRMQDISGKKSGVIATFTDLTEMAQMRRELQQQDRMAFIGQLSSELAHEIRNPLASIRGSMEEVHRNLDSPERLSRLADIALRESEHLNDIVSSYLDFARDPAKNFAALDCRELVEEVQDQLARKFSQASELTIELSMPDHPCRILGDRLQLRQVFMNLGQNAIEAMHSQGALSITVLAPSDRSERGPVEISFDDEGEGISPDKISRIFEPFFSEKESGVGMGLAVCLRIMTAHNGTIHAAARPGGGTSMIVRLPLAPAIKNGKHRVPKEN